MFHDNDMIYCFPKMRTYLFPCKLLWMVIFRSTFRIIVFPGTNQRRVIGSLTDPKAARYMNLRGLKPRYLVLLKYLCTDKIKIIRSQALII